MRDVHYPQNTNLPPPGGSPAYSCVLSSRGFENSEGYRGRLIYRFDPDPEQLLWTASADLQQVPTRGGQVVYAKYRIIGPLVIRGILRSRWDLLELYDFVRAHMEEAMYHGLPLRLVYPERDIDFSVYIQDINEVGIDMEYAEIVPYQITCYITGDHTTLQTVPISELGLPENVEWLDVYTAARIAERRFGILLGVGEAAQGEEGEGEGEGEQDGQEGEGQDERDVISPTDIVGEPRTPRGGTPTPL